VTDQHDPKPAGAADPPGSDGLRIGRARAAAGAFGRAVRSTLPVRDGAGRGDGESPDGDRESGFEQRSVPEATVARLAVYLRVLSGFAEQGVVTVSSEELASAAGVNSANLRKDLSHLGSYGTRGVGYDVALLVERIEGALGLTRHRAVALIGIGNLGHALAGYDGFASRGFHIAALLDADPSRVGKQIDGLTVRHVDELAEVVKEHDVSIGVIATPAHAAQDVCDALVGSGVTSILNFAPTVLAVPDGVAVRKVDLAIELQILSFHEQRKLAPKAGGGFGSLEGVI
jgi:redox-sensing transcriptional repressor